MRVFPLFQSEESRLGHTVFPFASKRVHCFSWCGSEGSNRFFCPLFTHRKRVQVTIVYPRLQECVRFLRFSCVVMKHLMRFLFISTHRKRGKGSDDIFLPFQVCFFSLLYFPLCVNEMSSFKLFFHFLRN